MRDDLGAMNRSVRLQRPSGQSAYETVETVAGAREMLQGATVETMSGGTTLAETKWRWMLHYRTDIKSEWRLEDAEDGKVFQVHGYGDPTGKKSRVLVFCTELQ